MSKNAPKIGVLVGEISGDQLGAPIIKALKSKFPDIQLCGVGGALLEQEGLKSYFDYSELSIMGIFEIIKRYGALNKRVNETIERMAQDKPDIVISVDAPEFAKRVVKKLRTCLPNTKFIHVVAPTVWAWRPKRARTFANIFDHLLCLFPFEPQYFIDEGMKADFIGHPAVHDIAFKDVLDINKIGILYGSRTQEIESLKNIFNQSIQIVKKEISSNNLSFRTLINTKTKPLVIADFDLAYETDKAQFLNNTGLAIATSGTMAFELALAGIPHVIAYKVHPLSYVIIKSMIKTPYVHLANIIAKEKVVPEFLQHDATAQNLAEALLELYNDENVRELQRTHFKHVRQTLSTKKHPSEIATDVISTYIS